MSFRFLILIALSLTAIKMNAQKNDTTYLKEWKEIDTLITEQNLPKSALEKVNILYTKASANKQEAQVIKTLLYRMGLESQVTETDINAEYQLLQTQAEQAFSTAQKSILYCLQASLLKEYFNNNRWKFYQRSNTVNFIKEDIATWTADDFSTQLTWLYQDALKPAATLQQTSLAAYDAIIFEGNVRNLRPTLYDLLAHTALDYFKSGEAYITKPSYAFTITEPAAMGTAAIFLHYPFVSEDSTSHLLLALQLLQQLMQFHSADKDPSAYIDINLERIELVKDNSTIDDKEQLYKDALADITNHYPNNPVAEQAWYLQANIYAVKAATYQPLGDTSNRYASVEAQKIIDARLPAKDSMNEGISNMLQLQKQIHTRGLSTQVENINVVKKPFRLLVNYRNIATLYVRIIKLDNRVKLTAPAWRDDFWNTVTSYRYYKKFTQVLPATKDFQQHSTEIKVDGLPVGRYILLLSETADFSAAKDKMAAQPFDVSNISYINNGADYFVLNRETGLPLAAANIKVEALAYNYNTQQYTTSLIANTTTNSKGFFKLPETRPANSSLQITITKNGDRLQSQANNYYQPYNNFIETPAINDMAYENANTIVYFFTDRSIYRPGQTVYFKGIAITKNHTTRKPQLLQNNKSFAVLLKDVNGKEVDSLQLSMNDYGSFTGKFKIPENVLTGDFSIAATGFNGMASLNVEEYKRPTFYVNFDTLKNTYRLGDTIKISGKALSYAGNAADGATVKFTVQRNTRFIYDWMFWRYPHPRSAPQQITNGTVVTDENGMFEISFIAKADMLVDKHTDPVFDFTVDASVTDTKGETRDAKTAVSIGYKSLQLQLNVPTVIERKDLKQISISATNLAGQKVTAKVQLKIYPLIPEQRLIRKRYWEQPDQFIFSKKQYIQYFPTDEYKNETDYKTWQRKPAIVNTTINTGITTNCQLSTINFPQGWYAVEAITTDKDGNAIKDIKYIQVYDKASAALASPQYNFSQVIDNTVQPGEKAKAIIGTSASSIYIIQNKVQSSLVTGKQNNQYSHRQLKKGKIQIAVPVTAADKNGAGVYYSFVYNNRFYTDGMIINIPDTTRNLDISYESWRNKTEPGSTEKWSVKIKGSNGNKAAAELLTTMYDASLDQFKPHNWQIPDIWPSFYTNNNWQGNNCFTALNSDENWINENTGDIYSKNYDRLVQSGEEFWNGGNGFMNFGNRILRGKEPLMSSAQSMPEEKGAFPVAPPNMLQDIALKSADTDSEASGNNKDHNNNSPVPIKLRKNFNETAFFFPQLYADAAGNYSFSFTMPEALTQWKWMSLAHNKQLAFGYGEQTITTQKTLMVQPNIPRFLREGDVIEISAKISNLSDVALTGQASIELVDAVTNEPVDGSFQNVFPQQYFTAEAGSSAAVKFPVTIPFGYNKPLVVRIKAQAGNYSDGEENTIPVLTNRLLVTESLPLYLRGDTTKTYRFKKLLESDTAAGNLQTQSLTVEYTTNPAWYVVQALPYINDATNNECAEQVFNRFYINALGSYVVNTNPKIKAVFELWKKSPDGNSLLSALAKNEELKQLLLQETPWVLDAENETQQKKNIAELFGSANLESSLSSALDKLIKLQSAGGSFAWFKGGPDDRYITQIILTGIGKLKNLHALPKSSEDKINNLVKKAMPFLDAAIVKDYENLIKYKVDLTKNNISSTQIQYLFMRSYFDMTDDESEAYNYYFGQAKKYWAQQSRYFTTMITAIMYRNYERDFALKSILPSIIENAVEDKEKGMYWKDSESGYYWYQNPLEQQALIIEIVNEIAKQENNSALMLKAGDMQTWLIRQKQTNNWRTTKATADACYALLVNGNHVLQTEKTVTINVGSAKSISSADAAAEAGTGYIKERIERNEVKSEMGTIKLSTKSSGTGNNQPSWGAVYWQYFQDMDQITSAASPLSITKKLFIEKNTKEGKVIEPVSDTNELRIGDKVIIRIELRSDRNMEYVHLKDMRAAAMEPVNVLSGYKWQDGLGYYESTKDVATDFFISYLQKGTYVFEYPVRITHTGSYSAGIATVQSMYAPEFTSHSEGIKISVQ